MSKINAVRVKFDVAVEMSLTDLSTTEDIRKAVSSAIQSLISEIKAQISKMDTKETGS